MSNKNNRVAIGSLVSRSFKVLIAPVTILIISNKLSSEELAFYYTFFSLIAMQQLAELGLGHVIKQHISHSYKLVEGHWVESSRIRVKEYTKFAMFWFSFVSLFVLIIVGYSGVWYFSNQPTDIQWLHPWWYLVVITSISVLWTPIRILIESCQFQEVVIKSDIISGLISSLALWICLFNDGGLFSIPISSFVLLISSLINCRVVARKIILGFKNVECVRIFSDVLKEVFPLVKRVSIVWGVGFLFWNGFNFVSFRVYDLDYAGKVIFCIALAKAGFNISESIIQGQMTIFSKNIADKKEPSAKHSFRKFFPISLLILSTGYSIFLVIGSLFGEYIYIYNKLPGFSVICQIFIFFFFVLIQTTHNNFIRCYKIEPFVTQSIILAFGSPGLFYLSTFYFPDYPFVISIALFASVITYNYLRYYRGYIYA